MSSRILDLILFDHTGQEKFRLPNMSWMTPSPDGQWIIARTCWFWKVYTLNGDTQTAEEEREKAWLDDSSGFHDKPCNQEMRLHTKTNGWQPMTVYPGKGSAFFVVQKR